MRNEVILVSAKAERGLLSICDNKTKLLMPILGSLKLIDIYLKPLFDIFSENIIVFTEGDESESKEYLIARYPSKKISIISYESIGELVSLLQKLGKHRRLVLIIVDQYVEPELINNMVDFAGYNDNLVVEISGEKILGFVVSGVSGLLKNPKFIEHVLEHKLLNNYTVEMTFPSFSKKMLRKGTKRISNVVEYYEFHKEMLKNCEEICRVIQYYGLEEEKQSLISNGGFVKDSFLYPSSVVEGIVHNSIISRNTRIGRGSVVRNSIIMDNNYIGNGCIIQNTVVCSNREQLSRIYPNIGDGVVIGGLSRKGRNKDYPEYLRAGLTLIGRDVEVPRGMKIPENCYIASGVGRNSFKNKKLFKDGDSLLI